VEPPPRGEEHEDTIIEGLAAASPTEEVPSEAVFLSPASGLRDPRSVSGADLIVEQPEEGVERGVEGGDPRAVDPFAAAAPVVLLPFEEPGDEPSDVRTAPDSVRQGPRVDAAIARPAPARKVLVFPAHGAELLSGAGERRGVDAPFAQVVERPGGGRP